MFEDVKGKRLLVIGSDEGTASIVRTAREMGVYTAAVDGTRTSDQTPAKRLADESWDLDYRDAEQIAAKCREKGIDGVLAGYSEFRVLAACRIARLLGTPFYATEEQIHLTWNKQKFKDLCRTCGVRVPEDYLKDPRADLEKDAVIRFPVIVKPVDYAGRNGITVCETREELDRAVAFARSKSVTGSVLVEDYIAGQEFAALYTVVDGEISFSSLKDKYINQTDSSTNLCELSITPSCRLDQFVRTADEKIRRFIEAAGIRNGVAQFQGIVNQEGFWIFEMSYRLPGGNDYVYTEQCHGINYLKMMISYSLTGKMGDDIRKDSPYFDRFFAQYLGYAHGGTVGSVDFERLKNAEGIQELRIWTRPGSVIQEDGTTKQKVFNCKLSARSLEELIRLIRFVGENAVVKDTEGKNMLFQPFDTGRIVYPA